ncbi:hypothetical protein [Puniceicoccus vermicola]|uniref:Uncharacterized protein n=1 Tax=Puniceicoccus vermicola TaxID=388746 RepID=A0A7X1E6I7_9BACT|nr:hypothetical protein [Puniceicoccus vermicola]MBC2604143.1 hypothetical protein [Puniceicoccus vermicola]
MSWTTFDDLRIGPESHKRVVEALFLHRFCKESIGGKTSNPGIVGICQHFLQRDPLELSQELLEARNRALRRLVALELLEENDFRALPFIHGQKGFRDKFEFFAEQLRRVGNATTGRLHPVILVQSRPVDVEEVLHIEGENTEGLRPHLHA